jgi:hypothetical protein
MNDIYFNANLNILHNDSVRQLSQFDINLESINTFKFQNIKLDSIIAELKYEDDRINLKLNARYDSLVSAKLVGTTDYRERNLDIKLDTFLINYANNI